MGKFNEYTQKATPEDADSLMIYDAAAKANKLSPFSGIWNWIVGKLTNAVISNLKTQNKSVIGALNELNSNLPFGATKPLNTAFDYNDITTTGLYYLDGSDPALAKNRPGDCTNCYMLVFASRPTRVCQIILPGNDDRAWIRSTVTDSSEWRSWVVIF